MKILMGLDEAMQEPTTKSETLFAPYGWEFYIPEYRDGPILRFDDSLEKTFAILRTLQLPITQNQSDGQCSLIIRRAKPGAKPCNEFASGEKNNIDIFIDTRFVEKDVITFMDANHDKVKQNLYTIK